MLNKRLGLALSLLVLTGSLVFAARYITGQPNQQSSKLKMRVLRGKDNLKLKPTAQEVAAFKAIQEKELERKLKTRDFKGMPVAVVEVRNLQSETWYEDLEIELKNISGKPIYFLTARLEFPDDIVGGTIYGIVLSWGDPRKIDSQKYAAAEAVKVEPGKVLILTVPEMYRKGLRAMQRMRPHVTKNLRLWFEKTYFGDGTGFETEGRWKDFRRNGPKPEKKHHSDRKKERTSSTTSIPDQICGGGNCFRWVIPASRAPSSCWGCETFIATASPDAECTVLNHARFDCDGDGIAECYDEFIDLGSTISQSCEGAIPTRRFSLHTLLLGLARLE